MSSSGSPTKPRKIHGIWNAPTVIGRSSISSMICCARSGVWCLPSHHSTGSMISMPDSEL
ncbi:hypothetical protein [Nonomuraea dietziae]|uniref:hypothetical protein n=1 Tax=Nonomuraea dietziae TaxID=65515 RepID=UPI0031CEE4E9